MLPNARAAAFSYAARAPHVSSRPLAASGLPASWPPPLAAADPPRRSRPSGAGVKPGRASGATGGDASANAPAQTASGVTMSYPSAWTTAPRFAGRTNACRTAPATALAACATPSFTATPSGVTSLATRATSQCPTPAVCRPAWGDTSPRVPSPRGGMPQSRGGTLMPQTQEGALSPWTPSSTLSPDRHTPLLPHPNVLAATPTSLPLTWRPARGGETRKVASLRGDMPQPRGGTPPQLRPLWDTRTRPLTPRMPQPRGSTPPQLRPPWDTRTHPLTPRAFPHLTSTPTSAPSWPITSFRLAATQP